MDTNTEVYSAINKRVQYAMRRSIYLRVYSIVSMHNHPTPDTLTPTKTLIKREISKMVIIDITSCMKLVNCFSSVAITLT